MRIFFKNFGITLIILIVFASCGATKKQKRIDENEISNTPSLDTKAFSNNYSKKLGIRVPETANPLLVMTVYDWIGVPYKYGGNDKTGVDCSGFIHNIYPQVYQIEVPRVSAQMHQTAKPIERKSLYEGDLVFFKINTTEVGHAGIYLFDNYFVHSTTTNGVIISSLEDKYWRKYFVGGGRFSH